jgi:hypothetical protein
MNWYQKMAELVAFINSDRICPRSRHRCPYIHTTYFTLDLLLYPEDGEGIFLRNISNDLVEKWRYMCWVMAHCSSEGRFAWTFCPHPPPPA